MQRQKNDVGHLILFTRYPQAGATKTRLIPALGAEGAAHLQRRMSEATFAALRACCLTTGSSLEVRVSDASSTAVRPWLPGADQYADQGDGDLGARLDRAITEAFARGHGPVVVVGADCPALGPTHLATALRALPGHDLVLGPATDGGYYLIGLSQPQPELFAAMPWGTDRLLHDTLARAASLGLTHLLLEPLPDVDRPHDLAHLGHHPGAQ